MEERLYQGILIIKDGPKNPYMGIYGLDEREEFFNAIKQGKTLSGANILRYFWLDKPLEWKKGMGKLASILLKEESLPKKYKGRSLITKVSP